MYVSQHERGRAEGQAGVMCGAQLDICPPRTSALPKITNYVDVCPLGSGTGADGDIRGGKCPWGQMSYILWW